MDRVPDTTDKEKQSSDILKVGEANQSRVSYYQDLGHRYKIKLESF
jgi:hypothetical protein